MARWLALAIGKRFKDKMNYLIAGVFIFEQFWINAAMEINAREGSNIFKRGLNLPTERFVSFYLLFLSPSISYMLFYALLFWIGVAQFTIRNYTGDDPEAQVIPFIGRTIVTTVACAVMFWILQKRELKNFLAQLDAQQREVKAVKKE